MVRRARDGVTRGLVTGTGPWLACGLCALRGWLGLDGVLLPTPMREKGLLRNRVWKENLQGARFVGARSVRGGGSVWVLVSGIVAEDRRTSWVL